MTIIAAAFRSPDDYAIGADSLATTPGGGKSTGVVKVVRRGRVLVGAAGAWAQAQRLIRILDEPASMEDLVESVAAARTALIAFVAPPGPGALADTLVDLLTVGPWGIVEFDSTGGWLRHSHWWAIGSGAPEGRGAMHAVPHASASDQVDRAVRAAIALDTGCGGEPLVLTGPA